jgi:hypothetical protein
MNLERYQLETYENLEIFEFISIGPNGKIIYRIKYIKGRSKNLEPFYG